MSGVQVNTSVAYPRKKKIHTITFFSALLPLVTHKAPQVTESRSLLRRGSGSGLRGGRRRLVVDKFGDSSDLDVISRAEREDVYGFGVERRPARDIAVEPGLYGGMEGPGTRQPA